MKHWQETLKSPILSNENPTCTGSGMNLRVRDDSPATYHVNYRTVGKTLTRKKSVSLADVPDFRKGLCLT
jgi:hypothetical protein